MFGSHKRKREKQKAKIAEQQMYAKEDAARPQKEKEESARRQIQVAERTKSAGEERTKARQEGRKYAEDVINRDVQGLNPQQRNAMQYEANRGIHRQAQTANRKLLGEQGQRGIGGKSGVGYAQQRDLQRAESEAKAGVHRDLDKLNSDLALKKIAAMFNIEQGEASQAQLDRQLSQDEAQLENEQERQRRYEDKFNRLFSRV